ncbi:MAG: F0F1 ATP synthase subunit A [Candidatus Eremiobacterota bacterium]
MELSPDFIVYSRHGPLTLNATLVFTWLVMLVLVSGSWLVTRRLKEPCASRWQGILEMLVVSIRDQIRDLSPHHPGAFVPFVGTLFLFISVSNLLTVIPGFHPPTGSLSTTAALALSVFFAVPLFGIAREGLSGYLRHYVDPNPIMLPFHLLGELTRTLALAVRLFGNVMSGSFLVAVLLAVAPVFFPVVMRLLELVLGQVQAYIFAVLAMVYIASAARTQAMTRKGGGSDG